MKTNNLIKIAIFSLLIMGIYSCGDDNDAAGFSSEVVVNGVAHDLWEGYMESYGSNGNGSFDFDVELISPDVQYVNGEYTGFGHLVYLDLNSGDGQKLEDGTYNFSDEREAFTLVAAEVIINTDFETGDGGQEFNIADGTINVTTLDELITELSWTLTSEEGTSITGIFRGELTLK